MASDGASLLRSGAPTENPFLAFQPIPMPPPSSAPDAPSDEDEPPEVSRRNRHTASTKRRSPQPAFQKPSLSTAKKVNGGAEAGASSTSSVDPFALSNFDWASPVSPPKNVTSSSSSSMTTSPHEEDFLGDFLAGSTTTTNPVTSPPTVSSNPFEAMSDPFAAFIPTSTTSTNIFEPASASNPASAAAPAIIPSQTSPRTNSRRVKRRNTAPVGSIDAAVETLRASNSKERVKTVPPARPKPRTVVQGEGDESDSDSELDIPVVSPKAVADRKAKEMKRRASEPAVTQLHDCLSELHRGTALLKYGRRGYPHFRQFQLSNDNCHLQWFSKKKGIAESSIDLREINEVRTGQTTPEFERVGWTSLAPASFSIVYANRTRRLSLVAKSVDEQKMWVEALRTLRDKAKKGHNMAELDSVLVKVDYRDRNRPQSRRHSGKFVRGHETQERNVDNMLHKKLISDVGTLKERFRQVVASANHPTIMASDENDSIRQILSELEERLEELDHEVRNTRDTKIAENDVWRTKVDMEALEEKIQVIIRPKRRWSIKRT